MSGVSEKTFVNLPVIYWASVVSQVLNLEVALHRHLRCGS